MRETEAAFLTGHLALSLPLPEITYLRSALPHRQITPPDLSTLLSHLSLTHQPLTTSLFTLCTPHPTTTASDFITLYAALRHLIFPSPPSITPLLYLTFRTISHPSQTITFTQWHHFTQQIGLALGGIDSPPCEHTVQTMKRAWRKHRRLSRPALTFAQFHQLMQADEGGGGFLDTARAIAFVLVCGVISRTHGAVERPLWTGDRDGGFLGSFLTHAIGVAEEDGGGSSGGGREVVVAGGGGKGGTGVKEGRRGGVGGLSPVSSVLKLLRRAEGGPGGAGAGAGAGASPFEIDFSALQLGERIGSGAYGDVYVGTFLMSPVAVKVFEAVEEGEEGEEEEDASRMSRRTSVSTLRRFRSGASRGKYRAFVHEVGMLSVVRHPNLVLYMGACGDGEAPMCIVTELFTGGSLYEYLHEGGGGRVDAGHAAWFALNVARGMFYLHASAPAILHRDLKSRNVLMSGRVNEGKPHVVICDFGLCELFTEGEEGGGGKGVEGVMGTASYVSPNVIRGERFVEADDVYSFGVLMWEMFTGCVPWKGVRPMQVMYGVLEGRRPECEGGGELADDVRSLIEECWSQERELRPDFGEVIERLEAIYGRLSADG